jgi:hypothetical protein
MTEEKFSPQDSLLLIQSMIDKTKQGLQANSFYFLLWGWLVLAAALLHFFLMKFSGFKYPYIAWNLMWIGAIASIVKGVRSGKREKVKTYIGETMKYFGISIGIIYAGLAFIFARYQIWQFSYPVYILIYAMSCFFMGSLMQFSFLKWAGLSCLAIMVVSAFVDYEWQLLLLALAVFISYIIPGHILNSKNKFQPF